MLTLVVCDNMAEVGLRASSDVPRSSRVKAHPEKTNPLAFFHSTLFSTQSNRERNVLGLLQLKGFPGALALKQVTVSGSLFHSHRVDRVSLLKDLLLGGVFLNEAGNP